MKDERKIIIWNERLRKIRNNLREIIIQGVYNEIYILNTFSKLYGPPLDLTPEEEKEMYYLQGTIHKLNEALNKSICKCPICTQTDKDMVYIDLYETWYCVECQENDLICIIPWEVKKKKDSMITLIITMNRKKDL